MTTTLTKRIRRKVSGLVYPYRVQLARDMGVPTLIWTMGKVGSTSIAQSLMSHTGRFSVFTSHFMNDVEHPRSVELYKHIIQTKHPIKIITLVRDPISKNISSFFQDFEKNTGSTYAEDAFEIEALTRLFIETYDHESPLVWFDQNIKKHLGIDIYETPFDIEERAQSFSIDDIDLLVLRCDLDNESKARQVSEFLGLEGFSICNKNVSAQKSYATTYKAFKQNIHLPKSYLVRMIDSKYFQHFYNAAERDEIVAKWRRH